MRQQLCNAAGRVRRKPLENILQVRMRLVAVQTRRVHQTHDGRSSLAGAQAAGEQPVLSSKRNHEVILPMSGKRSKSSTAGTRCTAVECDASTASNERRVRLFTLR